MTATERLGRFTPAILCVGIVLAFTGLFFQQSSQRYVIDEAEFPLVAKAISETGRPVYYRGEDNPKYVGIWHPPLYTYSLAAWQQLFGSSHSASRAYGLFCALVAAFFGWLILRRLFPSSAPLLAVGWLALYLLHPYVIQSALIPDIDTTALVAISMVFLWLIAEIVVVRRWSIPTAAALLGLALGIAFLAKLTTPIAFIPLIAASLWLASRSWKDALAGTILAMCLAAIVFSVVWGSISVLAHLDFTFPFTFTRDSAVSKSGNRSLTDRLELLRPSLAVTYWLTPLLLGLFVVGAAAAARAWKTREGQVVLLAALYAVLLFFTYNVITGPPFGFPKYYAPALGAARSSPFHPWDSSPPALDRLSSSSRRRGGSSWPDSCASSRVSAMSCMRAAQRPSCTRSALISSSCLRAGRQPRSSSSSEDGERPGGGALRSSAGSRSFSCSASRTSRRASMSARRRFR